MCLASVLFVTTALCVVCVGLIFGKYYNMSNTFGYPDITTDLVQSIRDNTTDPVAILVAPQSSEHISYLAVYVAFTLFPTCIQFLPSVPLAHQSFSFLRASQKSRWNQALPKFFGEFRFGCIGAP